jgi:hypothetical protein
MKAIVLMMLFLFAFVSCESMDYKFKQESKIGIGGTDKDGNTFFCVYDHDIDKENFDFKTSCSFTAMIGKEIYECKEISLSKIAKDFSIKTDCKLILQIE